MSLCTCTYTFQKFKGQVKQTPQAHTTSTVMYVHIHAHTPALIDVLSTVSHNNYILIAIQN